VTASLRDLSTDLFATVFAFRAADRATRPPYHVLRREIEDLLHDFEGRAKQLDPSGDALFALVALVDETAMTAEWDGAEQWQPLGKQYGDPELKAGELFFERLNKLQTSGNDDLLEVYFTCLCAGFIGKYRDDPVGLASIRDRLFQRLPVPNLRDEPKLTPDAYGRNLERPLLTRRFPFWWAVPCVLATIALYVALYLTLAWQVRDIDHLATTAPLAVTGALR